MINQDQLPNRMQVIAESISEHLFDLKLALGVISDFAMTFGVQAKFYVESLELLEAIQAYVRDGLIASSMIVGDGIEKFVLENGNIVYTLYFGDNPKNGGRRGESHIQISYVKLGDSVVKDILKDS